MKTTRSFWTAALIFTFACAIMATGCNQALHGTWKYEGEPEKEAFVITTATFKDDNTCTAIARKGDDLQKLAGTYEFNGFHLKIKQPGKPDRDYDATIWMGTTLNIKSNGKSQTLKKQ